MADTRAGSSARSRADSLRVGAIRTRSELRKHCTIQPFELFADASFDFTPNQIAYERLDGNRSQE